MVVTYLETFSEHELIAYLFKCRKQRSTDFPPIARAILAVICNVRRRQQLAARGRSQLHYTQTHTHTNIMALQVASSSRSRRTHLRIVRSRAHGRARAKTTRMCVCARACRYVYARYFRGSEAPATSTFSLPTCAVDYTKCGILCGRTSRGVWPVCRYRQLTCVRDGTAHLIVRVPTAEAADARDAQNSRRLRARVRRSTAIECALRFTNTRTHT